MPRRPLGKDIGASDDSWLHCNHQSTTPRPRDGEYYHNSRRSSSPVDIYSVRNELRQSEERLPTPTSPYDRKNYEFDSLSSSVHDTKTTEVEYFEDETLMVPKPTGNLERHQKNHRHHQRDDRQQDSRWSLQQLQHDRRERNASHIDASCRDAGLSARAGASKCSEDFGPESQTLVPHTQDTRWSLRKLQKDCAAFSRAPRQKSMEETASQNFSLEGYNDVNDFGHNTHEPRSSQDPRWSIQLLHPGSRARNRGERGPLSKRLRNRECNPDNKRPFLQAQDPRWSLQSLGVTINQHASRTGTRDGRSMEHMTDRRKLFATTQVETSLHGKLHASAETSVRRSTKQQDPRWSLLQLSS